MDTWSRAGAPLAPEVVAIYHKTIEAGKFIFIDRCDTKESLQALKEEFGAELNRFMITSRRNRRRKLRRSLGW